MAKKLEETLPTKVGQQSVAPTVPAYLAEYQDEMKEQAIMLAEHVILPRLKIVQSVSSEELQKIAPPGSIVLAPSNKKVADSPRSEVEDEFKVVRITPLFTYTEFCKLGDLKDKETPYIIERTFDKGSLIATNARNPNKRQEGYGGKNAKGEDRYKYRFAEFINFPSIIIGGEFHGTEVLLSFNKGSFGTGQRFCGEIQMRRLPMWATMWDIGTVFIDQSADKKFWNYSISPVQEIHQKDVGLAFRDASRQLKKVYDERRLVADYNDEDIVNDPTEELNPT